MTKKQKIWLAIGLGMFIIPEVIWSPIGNSLYGFIYDQPFRDNMLMGYDSRGSLIFVVLIQFVCIISSLYGLVRNKLYKNIREGVSLLIVISFLSLMSLIVLYVLFATKNFGS